MTYACAYLRTEFNPMITGLFILNVEELCVWVCLHFPLTLLSSFIFAYFVYDIYLFADIVE